MRWIAAIVALVLFLPGDSLRAQQSPNETLGSLEVPEGFEVTLFASEPLVNNPTAIDIDARGRVWVTEGVNYRHSIRGEQAGPADPKADRVKILEDTDGDGRADKMTVFADGILVPMSIAVAGNKVFVGESPHLWVFEDTDGDDRADKKEALLTGFRGRDHDHGIHGLVLGPDGRLYFTVGDEGMEVTDRGGNRVAPQAGAMLRVNLDGTGLTVLADNFRNPYELAVDSWGNLFCSDNDTDGRRGVRLCWILEGGSYGWKGPPSPCDDHWREDLPGFVPKILATGAGSPCGILMYEGNLLSEKYQGSLLHADAGPGEVRAYHLAPQGAAYTAEAEVLVSSDDRWFRPVDVAAHPDGSIFIADWYDAGVGGHRYSDLDTGRIYRLAPKGSPLKTASKEVGALEGLRSPAPARRFLSLQMILSGTVEATDTLTTMSRELEGIERARAITLLGRLPNGRERLRPLIDDPDAATRAQVVRVLREQPSDEERQLILSRADDSDAPVRREVLLALRDVPTSKARKALEKLAVAYNGRDRFYLAALGLALRGRDSEFLVSLLEAVKDDSSLAASVELAWELQVPATVPFLVRVLASSDDEAVKLRGLEALRNLSTSEAAATVAAVVLDQSNSSLHRPALEILAYNLSGPWAQLGEHENLVQAVLAFGLLKPELTTSSINAIHRGRMASFSPMLAAIAQNADAPVEHRVAAVRALGGLKATGILPTLIELSGAEQIDPDDPKLDPNAPANPLAVESLRSLFEIDAQAGDSQARQLLLDRSYSNALRREAVRLVGRSAEGSRYLLDLAQQQQLPQELKGTATAVVHRQRDAGVRARAETLLPPPKSAAGKPLPPIATLLRREGDPERGRQVFFRKQEQGALCARCHRAGNEGETLGPDLSEIGDKLAPSALFDSILNPSAGIVHDYRSYAFALTDGQILTGLITEQTADRVVLKTAEGRQIELRREEIDEQVAQEVSLMPEELSSTLTEAELVDVVAFLETLRKQSQPEAKRDPEKSSSSLQED